MITPMLRPDLFGALATHAGDGLYEYGYLSVFAAAVRFLRAYDGDIFTWWADFESRPAWSKPEDMLLGNVLGNPRLAVHTAAATSLMVKPGARDGVSAEHAGHVLYGILSPELYLLLVRDCGWSPDQWSAWAYDILHAQLCSGRARSGARSRHEEPPPA